MPPDTRQPADHPAPSPAVPSPAAPSSDAGGGRAETAAPAAGEGEREPRGLRKGRAWLRAHPVVAAGIAVAVIAAIVGGTVWWLHARHYETTDDAFIEARTAPIGAQVAGTIVDLAVTDNQAVKAGTVLFRIDDRDYRAALKQADAQVAQAGATVANLRAQIDLQQSRIDQAQKTASQAEGALAFAREENTRYRDLAAKGAGSTQKAQQAASDLVQRRAAYEAAVANARAAAQQIAVLRTQLDVAKAGRAQAEAGRETARVNLVRTTVTAPVAGRITDIATGKGAYVQPGQAVMMLVPEQIWVTANFKETALTDMRPGQPVDIEVDAYPGRTFRGHVASIQAGAGSAFSLLPAENATGNFVKVVQRVPVKIVFDRPPDVYLGPGMSVVPRVRGR